MNTNTGLLLSVALILGAYFPAAAADSWRVEVSGLRVVAAPPAGSKDDSHGAFFQAPGVTVVATLTPPAGNIVSIKQSDSKLDSFTDDKGTDLLAVKSGNPFNRAGFGVMDSKGAYATVELQVAGLPAKGATTLNIIGKVGLQTASQTNQFTVENLEVKTNTAFTLGDLPVVISNVGTNRNPWMAKEYKYSITFSSPRDLESISSLEFFDGQGKKIEARKSSWGGGFMGYMMEYNIKQNVDHVKLVATCWQDLKTVEVPLAIKTGLGL